MTDDHQPQPLFSHCNGPEDTWQTFYTVACICHPSQGGESGDMTCLTDQAREALGPGEWPDGWTATPPPNLFDIFCKATRTPNPFGATIEMDGSIPVAPPASGTYARPTDAGPPGYRPAGGRGGGYAAAAPLHPVFGNVELAFSACPASTWAAVAAAAVDEC